MCVNHLNRCKTSIFGIFRKSWCWPLNFAGAHGILDPPCATKLRSWMGYQGWSPWRTCSLSPWIIREIPIRYVFSVFTHFCDFCPITDKDRLPEQVMELAKQSSGPFREYERLIDEIPSFKCVFGRESVMVLSWSGNCRRVNCIPLIWLRPSTFSPPKNRGYVWSLSREKHKAIHLGRFDHESQPSVFLWIVSDMIWD